MPAAFDIEDNVPVPTWEPHPDKWAVYPLNKMKVGQSIFIPTPANDRVAHHRARSNASAYMTKAKNEFGWLYTLRSVEGGLRVWRIG